MNNLILAIHVLKLISQVYFLNMLKEVYSCECKTTVPNTIVFNGHLISIALPLLIRMRSELKIPFYAFNLVLVILSAIYVSDIWFGKCHAKCDKLNKTGVQTYVYFYGINSIIACLMILGILVYTMMAKTPTTA